MSNANQVKVNFLGGVATCTAVDGERIHVVVERDAPVTVNRVPVYFWATISVARPPTGQNGMATVKFCEWPRVYTLGKYADTTGGAGADVGSAFRRRGRGGMRRWST